MIDPPSRAATVPVPAFLSERAKAALAAIPAGLVPENYPALDDPAGWRAYIEAHDRQIIEHYLPPASSIAATSTREEIAGVSVVRSEPRARDFPDDHIVLNLHGGALIFLGGAALDPFSGVAAVRLRATVISVDYRMPPDHPFPAGLDDCVAVYRALVARYGAGKVAVYGASAGGNLAAALVLKARDQGLAMPGAVILSTPEVDLTESGDSFHTLDGLDRLRSLMHVNHLYAAGAKLDDPYVSPLFGDFTRGFPQTFLHSGTRDLFLSNTVRMHRKLRDAGVEADLNIWDAMPHSAFGGAPEDDEVDAAMRGFLHRAWGTGD